MASNIVYEADSLIDSRARAIDKLVSDLALLDSTIRMLSERGCTATVRKGMRQMQSDWTIQLDIMRAHQANVTRASLRIP